MANTLNKMSNNNLFMSDIRQKITFSIIESYKNIRTNLVTLMSKKDSKILAITSPNASEGKSTTSLNIAITLSQLDKKVLIIDTDAYRPSLHKKLKIANNIGLLDIIMDQSNLKQAVRHHNEFLDIITCGSSAPKPSELISSKAFDDLLNKLRDDYDYIILDAPPVNPVSDALVIAQKVDTVIMVVRASITTHDAFTKAVRALGVLGIEVDGVILNGSDPRPKGYYKSKYSYYRSEKSYY